MAKPLLVIVSGLPCTGKTTIATEISNIFDYPLIYKDGIKEILFDCIGQSDREWSKKLSNTTYQIIFHIVEALLTKSTSIVIEGNFHLRFTRKKY